MVSTKAIIINAKPTSSGKDRLRTLVMPDARLDACRMSLQPGDQPILLRRFFISRSCPARIPDPRRLIRTCRREHGVVLRPLDVIDRIGVRGKEARFRSLLFLLCFGRVHAGDPDPLSRFPPFRDARIALVRIDDSHPATLGGHRSKTELRPTPCVPCRMRECARIGR